jgi:C4-dicarboxylate transporter
LRPLGAASFPSVGTITPSIATCTVQASAGIASVARTLASRMSMSSRTRASMACGSRCKVERLNMHTPISLSSASPSSVVIDASDRLAIRATRGV